MPNYVPDSRYGWVVYDLKDIARDLDTIATDTDEAITELEAALAHYHLKKVLGSLILATRISRAGWPSLHQQMQSLTTSASRIGTSTDSQSPQTNIAWSRST